MLEIQKITHNGWENCYCLIHSKLTMIVTADIGPRIIHFGFPSEQNIFHEFQSQAGVSGGKEWRSYGGHRLWIAPEVPTITYFPDNKPVNIEIRQDGLDLIAEKEESTGFQKSIQIFIDPDRSSVKILHTIMNLSSETKAIAPWAISVMRPGGMAILPLGPHIPWPGKVTAQSNLSLWSYTNMAAPLWTWGERFILAKQVIGSQSPQKLGMYNINGWAAYQNGPSLFIKRFDKPKGEDYPDRNCNLEVWTNHECLELETLGPLRRLEPGCSITHVELWYLFTNPKQIDNENDVDRFVMPFVDLCN